VYGLDEFDVLPGVDRRPVQRLVVRQQLGQLGQRGSLADGDVDGRVDDRDTEGLDGLDVETAFLSSSAGSIERIVASCEGW
jgi:hypothetical protein